MIKIELAEAKIKESKLHDVAHFGIRIVVGVLFIVHSIDKFDPGPQKFSLPVKSLIK
jgi:putative oxidoreductase